MKNYDDTFEIMTTEPIKLKHPHKNNININLENYEKAGKDLRDLRRVVVSLVEGRNNTVQIRLFWNKEKAK